MHGGVGRSLDHFDDGKPGHLGVRRYLWRDGDVPAGGDILIISYIVELVRWRLCAGVAFGLRARLSSGVR